MQGQWIGQLQGTNVGEVMLDLDDCGTHYEGHAFMFDRDPTLPSSLAYIRTANKALVQSLTNVPLLPLNSAQGAVFTPQQMSTMFAHQTFPTTAHLTVSVVGSAAVPGAHMDVTWMTNAMTGGTAKLVMSRADLPSAYPAQLNIHSWDDFKRHALAQPIGKFIYRGQTTPPRLRTSFHRTRRKDLIKYLQWDVPQVRKALTNRLGTFFDYNNPEQYAALLGLMQHHGFPTPMLDWTYSPFVAAFFAFRPFAQFKPAQGPIRIFAFDKEAWTKLPQYQIISFTRPHLSVIEPLFLHNPRGTPQQSVLTVTNVDDIEDYIFQADRAQGHRYLYTFDLPVADAKKAMTELDLMGINAASMFPGIDGDCDALKSRLFDLAN